MFGRLSIISPRDDKMLRRCVPVVMTLVFLLSDRSVICQRHCEAPGSPRAISFTISSRRNQTGHWSSHVYLRHGSNLANLDSQETGSWDVDVTQTSEKCEKWEAVEVAVSISAPLPRAGPGYELVPELGYYKLHTVPKTWPEARKTCCEEGGHLAVINSEKELTTLQGIFALYPKIEGATKNDFAHIGFHDIYEEGKYVTVLGDTMESAGYFKFAPGNPKGGRQHNCGCMHRTVSLHDAKCELIMAFFCEQELLL